MARRRKFDVDRKKAPRWPTTQEILAQEGDAGMTTGRRAQLKRAGFLVGKPEKCGPEKEQSG